MSAPGTMQVARTRSFTDTRVEEAQVPALEAGDALLRVEACGLCGSDASRWYVETKVPCVLGHEPAGYVVATGAGCAVREGERVFVHHHVACGDCPACRRGADTSCALFRSSRLHPGGFAQWLRVPRDNVERDTLVLPPAVDFDAATFIEPLACVVRAIDRLDVRPGSSVLIVGMGAMGLLCGLLARLRGAARVVGTDLSAVRRSRAPAWGFDGALDPREPGLPEAIEHLAGAPCVDRVLVGPASSEALAQALGLAAPRGVVVLFSPFAPKPPTAVSLHGLYFHELTLTASYSCGARETREALELIASGRVPVHALVSHRVGLEGVDQAIARQAAAADDWIKAIVYPHGPPISTA